MSKICKKKIAQIGSGFVGRAAGKGFFNMGHEVVFYDVKPELIASLRRDGFQAYNIRMLSRKEVKDFDFIMISVPTPSINKKVSLEYLESALKEIGSYLRRAKNFPIMVVRSTVPPGTTEDFVVPFLEKISGKKCKSDFGVSMNPEFLREVTAEKDFAEPWMTVIGANDEVTAKSLELLYRPFKAPISQMSTTEAELTKYAHNLLNATKISFFNELRIINNRMGIDPETEFKTVVKSAEAIWNPEYGIKNLGPYGGSCLPKDTTGFYTWAMERFNIELPVLKGTMETNEIVEKSRMPMRVVQDSKKKEFFKTVKMQH